MTGSSAPPPSAVTGLSGTCKVIAPTFDSDAECARVVRAREDEGKPPRRSDEDRRGAGDRGGGEIAKPLFPRDAEYRQSLNGAHRVIGIHWPLKSDPQRANERSRGISVRFTSEAVQDSSELDAQSRERADQRLRRTLEDRSGSSEPGHDSPATAGAPEVHWNISRRDLLG